MQLLTASTKNSSTDIRQPGQECAGQGPKAKSRQNVGKGFNVGTKWWGTRVSLPFK